MAHSFLFRSLATSMAFLVFISTSGLTIDAHFCSGHIKRISLLGKAKTCKQVAASNKSCCSKRLSTQTIACSQDSHDKGCCSNQEVNFEAELDFIEVVKTDISLSSPTLLIKFIGSSIEKEKSHFDSVVKYLNLKPPLPLCVILSLYQVYRL